MTCSKLVLTNYMLFKMSCNHARHFHNLFIDIIIIKGRMSDTIKLHTTNYIFERLLPALTNVQNRYIYELFLILIQQCYNTQIS